MARKPKTAMKPSGDKPGEIAKKPNDPLAYRLREPPGSTRDQLLATISVQGDLAHGSLIAGWSLSNNGFGGGLTETVEALREVSKQVRAGDLGPCESMLFAQAVSLNTLFCELTRRAGANAGEYPVAMERYMRLAFKAQAQARCTLETLAEIKNPRQVTFAKQVNNAGGHQQVNNGTAPAAAAGPFPVRTGETGSQQTQLLEVHDAEWMDAGAQGAPAARNPELATVAAFHRPAYRGRKTSLRHARVQRRRKTAIA